MKSFAKSNLQKSSNILLLLAGLAFFDNVQAQKSFFRIEYNYSGTLSGNVKLQDSINFISINENGIKSETKIKNNFNKSSADFSLRYIVKADDKQAIIYLDEKMGGPYMKVHTPSKLIFQHNQWYSLKNGIKTAIPFENGSFKYTLEHKTILGYDCIKVNGITGEDSQESILWICPQLPVTLMPGAGFRPMKGAILEQFFPATGAIFIATKIEKLQGGLNIH